MKKLTFKKAIALSFALHLVVLLISLLMLRQSNNTIISEFYTVSLISPEIPEKTEAKVVTSEIKKDATVKKDVSRQKEERNKVEEKISVEEKIFAIVAKKKVEQRVRLRSNITLEARGGDQKGTPQTSYAYAEGSKLFLGYYSKIREEIWQQWIFPDVGQKDLEVTVSIRIMGDGSIIIQNVEKSSGNPIFDRSALRALTKASPLSPPPYEMEIGVRFSL